MTIVNAPHPALRTEAKPVTEVNESITHFIQKLGKTLVDNSKRGIGLAAPQVAKEFRVFVTYVADDNHAGSKDESKSAHTKRVQTYINPVIIAAPGSPELGGTKTETPLEGCLSIPGVFGPVPRYQQITLEYQQIENDKLITRQDNFSDFPARLIQHELDHLDGILFTDYSLEYDLPVYAENTAGELEKIKDRSVLEAL